MATEGRYRYSGGQRQIPWFPFVFHPTYYICFLTYTACARWGERPTTSASLPLRHVVAGMNNRCFAYLFVFCCQLVSFRIWNVGLNKELLVCVLPVGFAPICTDRYYTAAIDSTRQHLITKGSVAEKSGAASEFFNTIYGLYRGTTTSRLGRTRNTQSRA